MKGFSVGSRTRRWVIPAIGCFVTLWVCDAQSTLPVEPDTATVKTVPVSVRATLAAACDANLITAQLAGGQRVVSVRNRDKTTFRHIVTIGLQDGDVVERVNGVPPKNAAVLSGAIRGLTPGQDLTLVVSNGGKRRTSVLRAEGPVPVESAPSDNDDVIVIDEKAIEKEWEDQDPWMLLVMAAPRMAYDANGVVIGVTSGALSNIPLAANLGLRSGDIIQSVNGYAITSEQAIFDVINALEGERHYTAKLLRNGKPLTLRYRVE